MNTVNTCPVCGVQVNKKRSDRSNKYCSRKCYSIDRLAIKENNPNWKDGTGTTNYGCQVAYRKRYPERRNARDRVYYAVKTGKLKRQPCYKCGNKKSEAHHEDYSKPLDVKWLC